MGGLKSPHFRARPTMLVPTLTDPCHMMYFKVLSVVTLPIHVCTFYVAVSLSMCMSKLFEEYLIMSCFLHEILQVHSLWPGTALCSISLTSKEKGIAL